MKRKQNFITKVILILLFVTGCLSFRNVFAEDPKLKFKIDLQPEGEEIEGGLVFDLYRIAEIYWDGANATYMLRVEDEESPYFTAFNGVNVGVNMSDGSMLKDPNVDLDQLANAAAAVVFGGQEKTIDADEQAEANTEYTTFARGLYLAIARSGDTVVTEDETDKYIVKDGNNYTSTANSTNYVYTFKPYLVFLWPDLSADNDPADMNQKDEDGVLVKYSYDVRFGKLDIVKNVPVYGGDATDTKAVIHVVGYQTKEGKETVVYDRLLKVEITDAKEYKIELKDIPVGTRVEVSEVYSGAGYVLKSISGDDSVTVTDNTAGLSILPLEDEDDPQQVTIVNAYDDVNVKGYGVVNTYTYDKDTKTWNLRNDLKAQQVQPQPEPETELQREASR